MALTLVLAASLPGPVEIPEDQHARATFEFTNGDRGEVECHNEHCSIRLRVFDHDYKFDEHTPGLAGIFPVVPHELHISKLDAASRMFWFGVEFECPALVLERHPGVTCNAVATIIDGRVQSLSRFGSRDQVVSLLKELGPD